MSLGMGETDRQTNGSQHCTMPPYGRGITITHTTHGYLHWVSFKHQRTAANWTHYHWNVSTSAVSASASYTPTAAQPFNFHATQKPLIYVHVHTDMPTIPHQQMQMMTYFLETAKWLKRNCQTAVFTWYLMCVTNSVGVKSYSYSQCTLLFIILIALLLSFNRYPNNTVTQSSHITQAILCPNSIPLTPSP